MKRLCVDKEIKLSFASVYYQKTNNQVEATNKTIIKILKRKIDENLETWEDLLPEVMWAYRTTIKTPIGHMLFALAFRLEVVTPSELIWPSARITRYDAKENGKM